MKPEALFFQPNFLLALSQSGDDNQFWLLQIANSNSASALTLTAAELRQAADLLARAVEASGGQREQEEQPADQAVSADADDEAPATAAPTQAVEQQTTALVYPTPERIRATIVWLQEAFASNRQIPLDTLAMKLEIPTVELRKHLAGTQPWRDKLVFLLDKMLK